MSEIKPTYYTKSFSYPSTPNISVAIDTITQSSFSSVEAAYSSSVSVYATTYSQYIKKRDYIEDRLMKDLCVSTELASVDLENNKYKPSIKADNYFNEAKKGYSLNNETGINAVSSTMVYLKDQFFAGEPSNTEAGSWVTTATTSVDIYDTRCITVDLSSIDFSEETLFITEIPNAINTNRIWNSYSYNEETGNTKQLTLKYLASSSTNSTTNSTVDLSSWVILDSEDKVLTNLILTEDGIQPSFSTDGNASVTN